MGDFIKMIGHEQADINTRIEYAAYYLPTENVVIIGSRHFQCISEGAREYGANEGNGFSTWKSLEKVDGFLTNTHKFIPRRQAMPIALKAGQISEEVCNENGGILYSENCIEFFNYTRVIKNFNYAL